MTIEKVIPSQMKYIDPYNQRIYDFNSSDNKVYLTRNINNVLKVIGNDLVVGGLQPTNLICTNNIMSITLLSGIMICDDTLVEITEETNLSIDCSLFDDSGYLVVHSHWQWLNTTEPNLSELRFSWVSSDGETIYNNGWDLDKDRILLCVIKFTKNTSNNIISYEILSLASTDYIIIKGKKYYLRNTYNSPLRGIIASLNYYLFDQGNVSTYKDNIYKLRAINGNLTLSTVTYSDYENNL